MSQDTWQFLGIIATAVLTLIGLYVSSRPANKKNKVDTAQGLIDQLQEERNEVRKEFDSHKRACTEEVQALRTDVARFRMEHMQLIDFAQSLRVHIRDEKGPPAPDWPDWMTKP